MCLTQTLWAQHLWDSLPAQHPQGPERSPMSCTCSSQVRPGLPRWAPAPWTPLDIPGEAGAAGWWTQNMTESRCQL